MHLRLVDAQEEGIITKLIWSSKPITATWLDANPVVTAKLIQTWNPEKTTLTRAAFHFIIHGRVPYSIPVPSMEAWLRVNGQTVGHGGWGPHTSCSSYEATVDVLPFFINGENTIEAEVRGYFLSPWADVTLTVTCEFILEYTGETPPPPKTPEEIYWEKIAKYLTYGAIGFGAIAFVGLVLPKVLRRK